MKIEFSENDLARVVKFLKYSEKIRHAEKYAYILDLKDGRGMLIFNEGGRSAFCKIFDGWKTEWGSGLYNHFSEELWLSYEGGAVELSENGYTINGKFYQDKFIQSGGANGFYKLAIDDEKERQNGSAFRFPCKIKKSENILFSGDKWYSIGFKKGAFTDVSSSGDLAPGAVNISVCFAGENLYKYGIKPGFFTQIFRQWQDRFVLRCYYDNTDFRELVITLSAPSAGVKIACKAADVHFYELKEKRNSELPPPSKWTEKQTQKSAENYKRAAAKFDVKKQWGDIKYPACFYVDGENVLFGLEDAKVHIDKKLNGGAGFIVTGNNGKKYLLEMDNNFWKIQSDYENDPYNPDLYVKMKEGAKFDIYELYGGDIVDAFACDLSNVFDPADPSKSLYHQYREEWEEFQIYGYKIDWGTARAVPTNQTDSGRALQVESEDGKASFIFEPNFDVNLDFYVNFNLLEYLDRDYIEKDDIIKIIDAFPVNWNETDPARPVVCERPTENKTDNTQEQTAAGGALETQPEQKQEPAPVVETEPEPESDNINPQPEKEQKEMQPEKQTETKHETTATFPPAAVRLDPLELWGEPLDYSRVQVIKHNAQECGLALMVYNVKGEGALFAMLASFWAIVKERSQFDETAQRFIEDNFESVICFFDKEPEGGEIEPEPGDLARNWMQDAAEVKRESVSIPAPIPVPAPVVACKVAAPVIPEPEPKQKAEKPTWTELKYALSLLAMEFSIDDLISKFLKKTSKPVRKSIVEKLLFEIDRGSVPKPGESKREYIKTYYQTH